ncbi:MAG: iron-containing alcohol dehydrogenase [Bacteroidetes bacterium]|nr:iron-containing alcohol dehydrogenase [Bacteroidota bacterium]MCL2302849.1 iron-containing alcohol dehydrogenase [Lentimicrobiaceae bacterium]
MKNNFEFQNPTKLIFGRGMIAQLATELPKNEKILITYGGGSVKQNGVYEQVCQALKGFDYVEFWGIEPNPTVETLRKAIALGKQEKITYILAVGGGSVIDGTKLVASAIPYAGDAWELVLNPSKIGKMIPFASVLTLPATGSEMNSGAVISNTEKQEKFAFFSSYPQFSILDPTVTFSLPDFQIASGIADTFIHVLEQYLTVPDESPLMDRWSEGILQTLIELAPKIKANKTDYDAMSEFMLCATMALNGFIAMGVSQDWTTHLIGHEITALHGTTHGQTLVIVMLGTMKVLREQKKAKLLQYGSRIFNINDGTDEQRIDKTIDTTEQFFRSIGLATRLNELNIGNETIAAIKNRFLNRGTRLGECGNVDGNVTEEILNKCL